MGCDHSRAEASEEEQLITSRETALGFSVHPAQVIDAHIKREALSGALTLPKLKRLLTSLQMTWPLDDPTSPSSSFIERLKVEGVISHSRLAIAGLLLGRGSLQLKAQLLFEHADVLAVGRLERSAVSSLFEEISYVAVKCLPVLALNDKASLQAYQDRLSNSSKRFIPTVLGPLMQSEAIDQENFVAKLTHPELNYWLEPTKLRQKITECREDVMASIMSTYNPSSSKPYFFKRASGKPATQGQQL
jgi:hypothetical protein